jgi:hypothetical protein
MSNAAKKIEPHHITQEQDVIRRWHVKLPEGVTADDLNSPDIWVKVQIARDQPLSRHDLVYVVGHDDSFAVEARVAQTRTGHVLLTGTRVLNFPPHPRHEGKFKVERMGAGYAVVRIADGMQVGEAHQNNAQAVQHLERLNFTGE